MLYGIANSLAEGMDTQAWAGMLDPFGVRAASIATRYWSVFEMNTQVIPLEIICVRLLQELASRCRVRGRVSRYSDESDAQSGSFEHP